MLVKSWFFPFVWIDPNQERTVGSGQLRPHRDVGRILMTGVDASTGSFRKLAYLE